VSKSWDPKLKIWTSDPTGTYDNAAKQPEFGTFPGYKEEYLGFYKIKQKEEYDFAF